MTAAIDDFGNQTTTLRDPAKFFAAVTPSDTVDLAHVTRFLYVGTSGGDVAVKDALGNSVTFPGVPAGTVLPVRTSRVLATGTTATAIVAMW